MSVRLWSDTHGRKTAVWVSNQTKGRALDVIQENRSGCFGEGSFGFSDQIGCSTKHGAMDHIVVGCLFWAQSKHRFRSGCAIESR